MNERYVMREIHIYTDGSCDTHDTARPGGWAAILIDLKTGKEKEIKGNQWETTNNEMEIVAAIKALQAIKGGPHSITIRTDSQYLIGVMTGNKRKKNKALLQQLDDLVSQHGVTFEHVEGHGDDEYNNHVDRLAIRARESL